MSEIRSPIAEREYEVNTFFVDPQQRLSLFGLLNFLQDTAWAHATELGHGYERMIEKNQAWVLARQRVVMRDWPRWGERVRIRTWVRPQESAYAIRDFEVAVGSRGLGECSTSWLTIDLGSRRPVRARLEESEILCRTDGALGFEAPKLEARTDLEARARFEVRYNELDLNEHVNNTRYAQWILDALPLTWHHANQVTAYDVNFLAEVTAGETIELQAGSGGTMQFQGARASDRKLAFIARLEARQRSTA